ncbi:hypothetical protein RP20_CCG028378 [Aedes albopictus]|nr:hypothetical protein RP20_CCG028378 [Aedes albopictus]
MKKLHLLTGFLSPPLKIQLTTQKGSPFLWLRHNKQLATNHNQRTIFTNLDRIRQSIHLEG